MTQQFSVDRRQQRAPFGYWKILSMTNEVPPSFNGRWTTKDRGKNVRVTRDWRVKLRCSPEVEKCCSQGRNGGEPLFRIYLRAFLEYRTVDSPRTNLSERHSRWELIDCVV